MHALQLVYILSAYPGLTTTFVDREVQALRRMGIPLRILAINRPETMLSEEQKEIQRIITYLQPVERSTALRAHLRFALTRPARYFSTLAYLLTRRHSSLNARRKTLRHFSLGVVSAYHLRNTPVDHIHVHIVNWAVVALTASRLLGVPYSVTAHASGDIYVNPVLLKEKMGNAKFVATCTRYNMDYLKQYGKGVFSEKVKCIYHGLNARDYVRDQAIERYNPPVIIGVGQLKERKGFKVLVEACGILKQQGVDFECRIIGEGPMRAELEDRIQRLGLTGKVILYGALPHDEVFRQYEQSSIFALPALMASDGDRDGIPNVILEAMAMELPVVSTCHSAIPEAVEDGVNGLLVPPDDPAALAAALHRLLSSPELRLSFGQKGRQTVIEKFDPEKNTRRLLEEITA